MDRIQDQIHKSRQMVTLEEKLLAEAFWRHEMSLEQAEKELGEWYTDTIRNTSTKEEAEKILARMPDCVSKVFLIDYIHYQRDWTKPHQEEL